MNPETGKIYDPEQLREMAKNFGDGVTPEQQRASIIDRMNLVEMQAEPTTKQRLESKVDKYDPCPCGSGKQFKCCCWTGGAK